MKFTRKSTLKNHELTSMYEAAASECFSFVLDINISQKTDHHSKRKPPGASIAGRECNTNKGYVIKRLFNMRHHIKESISARMNYQGWVCKEYNIKTIIGFSSISLSFYGIGFKRDIRAKMAISQAIPNNINSFTELQKHVSNIK